MKIAFILLAFLPILALFAVQAEFVELEDGDFYSDTKPKVAPKPVVSKPKPAAPKPHPSAPKSHPAPKKPSQPAPKKPSAPAPKRPAKPTQPKTQPKTPQPKTQPKPQPKPQPKTQPKPKTQPQQPKPKTQPKQPTRPNPHPDPKAPKKPTDPKVPHKPTNPKTPREPTKPKQPTQPKQPKTPQPLHPKKPTKKDETDKSGKPKPPQHLKPNDPKKKDCKGKNCPEDKKDKTTKDSTKKTDPKACKGKDCPKKDQKPPMEKTCTTVRRRMCNKDKLCKEVDVKVCKETPVVDPKSPKTPKKDGKKKGDKKNQGKQPQGPADNNPAPVDNPQPQQPQPQQPQQPQQPSGPVDNGGNWQPRQNGGDNGGNNGNNNGNNGNPDPQPDNQQQPATPTTGKTNDEGVALIKSFEGFVPNFYNDDVGIKTIGYGHACHSHDCSQIHPPLTEAQGVELLKQDLASFEQCVSKFQPELNSNQFSALVSFVYNLGCGALTDYDMAPQIKNKDWKAAAANFETFCKAGGKVLPGLVRRRKAERDLFCKSGGC